MLPGDQIIIPTKDMTVEIRLANTEAATYGTLQTIMRAKASMSLMSLVSLHAGT
jgi:hypothetical protein